MHRILQWLRSQPRSHHLIALVAAVGAAVGFTLWWAPPTFAPHGGGQEAQDLASALEGRAGGQAPQQPATRKQEQGAHPQPGEGAGGVLPASKERAHPQVRRPVPEGAGEALRAQLEAAMATVEGAPEQPEAWLNLGTLRNTVGDDEGAEEAWRYANTLRPSYVLPLVNLATQYALKRNDLAQAEAWFAKARAQNPAYLFTYQQYADVMSGLLGEHSKAEAFLRAGIAQQPEQPALWFWLGEVLERAGRRGGDALYAYLQAKRYAQERLAQLPAETEAAKAAQAILEAAQAGIARLSEGEHQ